MGLQIHDRGGVILAKAETRAQAVAMLRAYVATAPGREDELTMVTIGPSGSIVLREDVFDVA
jgi:hypothetical protein